MKLHCLISLGLGLKRVKITRNIAKVGMRACVSNGHPNVRSNFNFEKLVKRETLLCGFTMVWLKGGINTSEKWWKLACMFVYQMVIKIYDQILILTNWSKVKLHRAVSLWLGLNGVKIAQKITKVGLHARLSNGNPNLWSNFNSVKLVKSETPSCGFSRVGFKRGQNSSSVAKVGMHACQYMSI